MDVTISWLGSAGDGVAETPQGLVFLPGTLPGEQVRARLGARRGEGVAAEVEAILAPSPDRVDPPCPHFLIECGACALQHLALPAYAAWKRERLVAALDRAGQPDAAVAEIVLAPPGTRRRADLAVKRLQGGAVALGFHQRGSAAVADLSTCHVLDPALVALFRPLRELLRRMPALKREGSAVLNLLDSGPDLLLRTDGPLDASQRAMLAAFGQAHGLPRIAWALKDGPVENAAQAGPVRLDLSGVSVAPAPGAFLQAAPVGEAAIIAAVLAGLAAQKLPVRARIADLYAGIGTLSFPLSAKGRVAAYEGDAAAVATLDAGARKAGGRVEAIRRDLAYRPLLPAELNGFGAVVLDPPYNGAAEQVAQITRSKVPVVIYVSCNPVALARDAGALVKAGFKVTQATPVDQFPWSPHLESVVSFRR
ncbi:MULTISPECIES: class I SAM-dependent RNA methyltransferase [Roseomonadaceae]|uniref:Class I SAM-dependent RNA methyltransferase n=1 Tax=Falsiroseomonas oleicola TaxID=2801474 RepID=A0ABS6H8K9_9PROT|nr:class I SAM-dependent RNA methyltransferase [Roseomonas oleicola]MBU8543821.1 class I SAM-dependent RNA methyltransferase [Roseomonas oleicola]